LKFFVNSILYSYSQILFSNRRWLGALVLGATFVSPKIGLMSLLGVLISNYSAHLLKFETSKIESGFYGFNGILFGAATVYYYQLSPLFLLLIPLFIVITFLIAAVLENHLAVTFNLPGLSLPFIISLFIYLIFLSNYQDLQYAVNATDEKMFSFLPLMVKNFFKSLALIYFQPNILTGIVIAVGLLIFSRALFVLSISSYLISGVVLQAILPQQAESLMVLVGFNSILTAFALGGSLVLPSGKSFMLAMLATPLVVIFTGFFSVLLTKSGLPVLVLPFNFITLATIYSLKFRKDQTELVLLYFKPGSPEENLYFHQNKQSRFENFKFFFPELPVWGEWTVSQAHDGEYTHKDKWRYAWDFILTENGKQYENEGDLVEDYFCYGLPVCSPLSGKVVTVVDGIPDNTIGEANIEKNWGNTIIIDHSEGLFSALSHLKPGSIKVKEGEIVDKGDIIAACGNSGRSPYPHLHFQFQTDDTIGGFTHKFPFAFYLEKRDEKLELKTFDYPVVNSVVQNLEKHKLLAKAFEFKLGESYLFKYKLDGKTIDEEWTVKIDIYNAKYIESSAGGFAYIYNSGKVFYFSSFTGNKNCSLYYFYLSAMQAPLSFHEDLEWEDSYSVAELPTGFVRYLSEFFIFFGSFLSASGKFRYKKDEDKNSIVLESEIFLHGKNLFSWYGKDFKTSVNINTDGIIDWFSFKNGDDEEVFVKRIKKEEETG
jgi:urea transporter/murein DD-endopeptidase MepM/ murein hydrolase activator NlpD